MAAILQPSMGEALSFHDIVSPLVLPLLLFSLLLQTCRFIYKDYHFFLSLGPGGTPSTPLGYLRICLLRLIARRDVLVAPAPLGDPTALVPFFKSAHALPVRRSTRPRVAGIAPHRQMTQRGSLQNVFELQGAMRNLEQKNPGMLETGKSCFEKHSLALFLSNANYPLRQIAKMAEKRAIDSYRGSEWRNPTCGAPPEIAHLHGTDGSLHLTLHPSDAKIVMENGWGERHPLAGRGSWVPKGFLLIYAPRGEEELAVVVEIMKAGGWWVGGVTVEAFLSERHFSKAGTWEVPLIRERQFFVPQAP